MILNPPNVKVWIVNAVPDPDLEIKNGGLGGGGEGGHPDPEIIGGPGLPRPVPWILHCHIQVLAVGVAKT